MCFVCVCVCVCACVCACRSKLERNKDRDVSEKIALGLPTGAPSQEALFDQRLFNQSKVCVPWCM